MQLRNSATNALKQLCDVEQVSFQYQQYSVFTSINTIFHFSFDQTVLLATCSRVQVNLYEFLALNRNAQVYHCSFLSEARFYPLQITKKFAFHDHYQRTK